MIKKPKVLIITPYYLPAFKAGGPVASISNIVDRLGDEFEFRIVAPNSDLGDTYGFSDFASGNWYSVGKASVLYVRKRDATPMLFRAIIASESPDLIYFNSFFNFTWTTIPLTVLRLNRRQIPVILAPRGELFPRTIRLKFWKKSIFLWLTRMIAFYRYVVFQATDQLESHAIRRAIGEHANIRIARNLPTVAHQSKIERKPKSKNRVSVIFLSRIHPKKNLIFAIRALVGVEYDVQFTIAGPVEDAEYWKLCIENVNSLPSNVSVRFEGAISRSNVSDLIGKHDLFFLPTISENFGHVIFEALNAGTPVLVSDQTPWRSLCQRKAGWDLSLADPKPFSEIISTVAQWSDTTHSEWRDGARNAALEYVTRSDLVAETRSLLRHRVVEVTPVKQ